MQEHQPGGARVSGAGRQRRRMRSLERQEAAAGDIGDAPDHAGAGAVDQQHLAPHPGRGARPQRGKGGAGGRVVGVEGERRRGRGGRSNAGGRFEVEARLAFDDGWQSLDELPPFKTMVAVDTARKVITRNDSPDIGFDRSINPYRGCEHGCVYCFARPTHAYLGLSPRLDFESKLFANPDAPALFEKELAAQEYVPRMIAIGTNTAPYQPIERVPKIIRRILAALERASHPLRI